MSRRRALTVLPLAAIVLGLAGCQGQQKPDAPEKARALVVGTTESATVLDPAGSYDLGSWTLQYNLFEQLLALPAGGGEPVGDAAGSCAYDDPQTVTCLLRDGDTFSNGHDLTSSDVAFSLQRVARIADPNGPAALLEQISAVETPDPRTVVIRLSRPDARFLTVLATAAASIVDEETFPSDAVLPDDEVVGSGPYELAEYVPGERADLAAQPEYDGPREPRTEHVTVEYFVDPGPLQSAIQNGDIDVAWRTLSATSLRELEAVDGLQVLRGPGSELRYWAWSATAAAGPTAVRQSVAQLVDRVAIAAEAYDDTVDPAYSVLPPGLAGSRPSFETRYAGPDPSGAARTLSEAGIATPVALTLGYPATLFGPGAVAEAQELAAELTDRGLFRVELAAAEGTEYEQHVAAGDYDLSMQGVLPALPDVDAYLTPVLGGEPDLQDLLASQLAATDLAARAEVVAQLQDAVAEDVPLIPSWSSREIAVVAAGVEGVEETLDPTSVFRLWTITTS